MPGILGAIALAPASPAGDALARMSRALPAGRRLQTERASDPDGAWALERVHLGRHHPEPQLDPAGAPIVVLHGDPRIRSGAAAGRRATLALVRDIYRDDGPRVARALEGAFSIVILDAAAKRLLLAGDRLGSFPVYWHRGERFMSFAPSVRALMRAPDHDRVLDGQSLGDLLRFGFVLGTRTLDTGIALLPPASTLTFDWAADRTVVESWERSIVRDGQAPSGGREAYRQRVRERFNESVAACADSDDHYVISLSGGLDSRALLSAFPGRPDRRLSTYTSGVDGCADQSIAERLAGVAGTDHEFFERSLDDLQDYTSDVARMVELTDGMYMTHGATELNDLKNLEQHDYDVLLRGHGGELLKMQLAWPLHTDRAIAGMQSTDALIEHLLARTDFICSDESIDAALRPEWATAAREAPARSLRESLAGPNLSPASACAHLYLYEHHRRFTIASLAVFRQVVDVRMPFVGEQFLETVFSAPADWHDDTSLHEAIISRNSAALARPRNSNTGARVGAGPAVEFFMDKINSVLKRLNVRGYRHYHQLDRWLRDRLLAAVAEILLDERCLDRRVYDPDGLRRIITQMERSERDDGYLLQTLLLVELWHRQTEELRA